MRQVMLVASTALMVAAGAAVAQAHDADPDQPDVQGHEIGPYRVADDVVIDLEGGTTTGRYTVTPPAAHNGQTHLYLALPDCGYDIVAISHGGTIAVDGDPPTGTPGPAIRWKTRHRTTEPDTYWFEVRGVYEPEDARMGIRSGNAYGGTVLRPSCERYTTDGDGDDGEAQPAPVEPCSTALSSANDSDVVPAMVPPGAPGLRMSFVLQCPAGQALTTEHAWRVTVDGHAVALLRTRSELGGTEDRRVSYELHLPVNAISRICLYGPTEQAENGICAPPS